MRFTMTFRLCALVAVFLVYESAAAQSVPKEKFLAMFEVAAPALFCNKKSSIIWCYGYPQSKCLEAALPIAKKCVQSQGSAFPDPVDRSQAGEIAKLIGKCVAERMRTNLNLPPTDESCRH
jgi:hypothetical protein